jgi:anti-sigma factor RsiW
VDGERLVAGLRCSEVLADLSEYLEGGLPAARRAQLESHVRGCVYCERFGDRFAKAIRSLRDHLATADALDPAVAERLRERLRRELP